PLFLSSTVKDDNAVLAVDLSNPDVHVGDRVSVPRGTVHLARTKFLWQGVCHERFMLRNYGLVPIETSLSLYFEADFADIFEVRGTRRARRGRYLHEIVQADRVVLSYEGLDGVLRQTRVLCAPAPSAITGSTLRFDFTLPPQGEACCVLAVA